MKQAIGIFDSGLGGLTVMKEIHQRHPEYDYIYLGDNARAPYGPRDFETVYQYTLEAVQWLFNRGCPLVILACNTASAKALRTIQQKDLPGIDPIKRVLGVIRPTTEVIGDYTETKHIGILGTQGTVDSGSYVIEVGKAFPDVHVHQQACPDWVPLVESGDYLDFTVADPIIRDCLIKLLDQSDDIDTVLLACTHYPLLYPRIRAMLPPDITVVSQGEIVADSLSAYLLRHPEMETRLSKGGSLEFCTTGDPETFKHAAGAFWGEGVDVVQKVELL
ncbi:MAG: glutamate racemase [Chitinophagaceae bacterium]|jgi:glutamate racemase|nr:glutamate racemase [Chitinophagaceae bacterium]